MAENTRQFRWIVFIKDNLETLFQDRADVFVAGEWESPRLGIRFDTSGDEPRIFRPDGAPFRSHQELARERDTAQRAQQQAEQRAEQERQRATQAEQQAAALAAQLRALGIEPQGLETGDEQ
jgi:hypothetical protein